MSDTVLLAIIGLLSTAVTAFTTWLRGRASARHSAKQSILQMIQEDYVAKAMRRTPTNYQNILYEYDVYHKNGGNSYVTEKVEEYKKWFIALEKEKHENSIKE